MAEALGLSPADAVEHSGITHAQASAAADISRTRLTAILNGNTSHVSTDLMLRILAALGYRAKITFIPPPHAA